MSTLAGHQPQSTRWPLVFLAIFAGASGALCLGKVPAVLGILRSELGLTLVEASYLASAFNTLAILCSLFLGLLLTRWSGRQTGVVGLLVIVTGGALALPATGLAMMLLSRIVEGIGFLLVSVAMPAFIVAVTREEDKRLALSLWAVNLPLGAAAGMLLTPWLTAQGGWRLAWLILMIPQLSALLLLLASRSADKLRVWAPQNSINSGHPLRQLTVLRQKALWRYGLAFTLYSLMLWALFVWLPTMLQGSPGIGQSQIALLSALAVAVVANIPGNLMGAWLLRRGVARDRLISWALGLMALCGMLAFWPGLSPWWAYGLCLALSLAGGMAPPAILSSAQGVSQGPVQLAIVQGFFVQLANLGQLLGPLLLAALMTDSGHWGSARWLFLGGLLLVALLYAAGHLAGSSMAAKQARSHSRQDER
ncbi:MFS transporter [Aeromonas veronii bv. sobria]|uniref:MFS transporter n=1 Tax=Aeromonas veronii TaxID=654 RepID=A0ABY3MHS7_AERVE|nr:MFS transporter [Aeromonas veronii]RDU80466.1 MFS transporter [Aeromonas veronii]RDU80972.1 MFS transporter [Aeromonas veronii]TEY47441.1 MFS transporter [Aeromonas veronii]TEY74190.1 MFS transporter [Aeromonas veronii]TYD40798.1 MFS transporter [Aeromonas veronii]